MRYPSLQRKRPAADSRSSRHRRQPLVEELEPRNLMNATPAAHGAPPPPPPPPVYYNPIQLGVAYGFPGVTASGVYTGVLPGTGETIAIVDAYNDPTILSDVATFDSPTLGVNTAYGTWAGGAAVPTITPVLPGGSLPTTPWLQVENEGGTLINPKTTRSPATNSSWDVEIALDVEWSHAMAPGANILLVEANSSSYSDLLTAVSYAAKHAQVVSMSWGSNEFSGETGSLYDGVFNAFAGTGVTFVASSGDSGVVSWPAVSPDVVGVGGTNLSLNYATGAYGSETGWSDSGGGVSNKKTGDETIPSYQATFLGATPPNGASAVMRNSPDVAYDSGNSNTFVWVYDAGGWYGVYGTSAGAPQWSAIIASADQGRTSPLDSTQTLPALYLLSTSFTDITSGSNANGTAGLGYDLVTGLGSPQAGSVISGLMGYMGPASTTSFASIGAGHSAGTGQPSDTALDVLASVGVQTPLNHGPGTTQAPGIAFNSVQKLTAPPLEVVPTATAVNNLGVFILNGLTPGSASIVRAVPSVMSSGTNWAGGLTAGWQENAGIDHGTTSPFSPTAAPSAENIWTAWSSAFPTSTAEWGTAADAGTAGWPMFPMDRSEDVTNSRPEE